MSNSLSLYPLKLEDVQHFTNNRPLHPKTLGSSCRVKNNDQNFIISFQISLFFCILIKPCRFSFNWMWWFNYKEFTGFFICKKIASLSSSVAKIGIPTLNIDEAKNHPNRLSPDKQFGWFLFTILLCVATSGFHTGKPCIILGAQKLNDCVRHGNRWVLLAIITTHSALFLQNWLVEPSTPPKSHLLTCVVKSSTD